MADWSQTWSQTWTFFEGEWREGNAPLWGARLGRSELRARQVSRRGGELGCTVRGDRVLLEGRAVLVTGRSVSG